MMKRIEGKITLDVQSILQQMGIEYTKWEAEVQQAEEQRDEWQAKKSI